MHSDRASLSLKIAAFAGLLDELPKPVIAYCRTGNRSETLWKLARGG